MKLLFVFILLIITPVAYGSVQADSQTFLRINNADINFSSAQTFDNVEVGGTYIIFNNSMVSLIPTGQINATIRTYNITGDCLISFNESSGNHDTTTAHTIQNACYAGEYVRVNKNGATYGIYLANSTGYFPFTYTGGYSDVQFDIQISGISAASQSECNSVASATETGVMFWSIVIMAITAGIIITALFFSTGSISSSTQLVLCFIVGSVVLMIGVSVMSVLAEKIGC